MMADDPLAFATTRPPARCFRIHLSFSSFIRSSMELFLSVYQPSSEILLPVPPAVCITVSMLQNEHPANGARATAFREGVPMNLPPSSPQDALTIVQFTMSSSKES